MQYLSFEAPPADQFDAKLRAEQMTGCHLSPWEECSCELSAEAPENGGQPLVARAPEPDDAVGQVDEAGCSTGPGMSLHMAGFPRVFEPLESAGRQDTTLEQQEQSRP